jgi:uncharacterized transporter YbjL
LLMMIVCPEGEAAGATVFVTVGVGVAGARAGAVTVTAGLGAAAGALAVPHAAKPPIRARVPIPAKMVPVVFMVSP